MDEIYIMMETTNLSGGGVPHSSHARVYHNWRILQKYCCPGSDRCGKQSNQTRKRSCSKKRNETGCRLKRNGTGCSLLSLLFIETWLGATLLLLDLVLFHPDNIIEFLVYMINVVLLRCYRCIQSAFVALKSHMIEELCFLYLGDSIICEFIQELEFTIGYSAPLPFNTYSSVQ